MRKKKKSFQEICLYYRQLVILLVCILVCLGIWGLVNINKNEFPDYTVREGLVAAVYPGATSKEVEEEVTKPLENYIFTYKEVSKEKTVSYSRDGMAIIMVELNENLENKDEFWSKFKHGVQDFKATSLPQGVLAVKVQDDFGDVSSELISMESKDKTYHELYNYMCALRDSLRLIPSVGKMSMVGMNQEQISVYVNTERLAHYGVNIFNIAQKLAGKGFTTTGGRLKTPEFKSPVYVDHNLNSIYDIENTIVYSDPKGHIVRLKDVATVKLEFPELTQYVTVNGTKALLLSVSNKEGMDVSKMGSAVNKKLDHVKAELPADVKVSKITDQKQVVDDSIVDFLRELLIAITTVILVVVLIMPRQVAMVAAATMPVTIFISLGLFYIFDLELNTVTLAALIMTLGMIVDDSIVIIDGYVNDLAAGMTRWNSAIESTKHFLKSIFSATLCISITFFPFLVTMTGVMHDFLKMFPWAITIVLFVSMIIAQTLLPILMYFCIRKPIETGVTRNGKKAFNLLDIMQKTYDKAIDWCFGHRKTTIGIGIAGVLVGIIVFTRLPQKLMPIAQRDQFAVEIFMPTGSTVQHTNEVADSLEHMMRRDPRVISVASFHGMSSPRFQTTYAPQIPGENFCQFIVNTKSIDATEDLVKEYKKKYTNYFPEGIVKIKHLSYSKEENPIEVRITGSNLEDITTAARTIEDTLRRTDGLELVRTDFREPLATTRVHVNEDAASRLGLTNLDVEMVLGMRYSDGIPVSTAWDGDYGVKTVLKTDKSNSANLNDFLDEQIPIWGGMKSVPLREIARVDNKMEYGQIVHRNGLRTISVISEVDDGVNVEQKTSDIMKIVKSLKLPENIHISYGGQYETDNEQIPNIIHALLISIAIIFFVLIWHFRDVRESLIMLASLSLCICGAAFGILLSDIDVSLTCILGFVSLMGVLVRNGIILFDYAQELYHDEGLNLRDSILVAAKRRMRPIFLTSACASTGVIPMLLGGSSLWMPMAAVVFWGTIITMFFILIVMPVAYWLFMQDPAKHLAQQVEMMSR
ncbi:MAG: efflux RND transporter permease subunit [Prevotella sp.]|nr:efflux RND transporter permease subunit [Prevotella sp.]